MTDYVIGIDPGATGALALFNCQAGSIEKVWDMPNNQMHLTTGKKTKRVEIDALLNIFDLIIASIDLESDNLIVHIEKVQAFGKQAAPAAFNFGYAAALPFAIARAMTLEVKLIAPQTWKRQYNLQASAKDDARLLVRNLFPYLRSNLARKQDVDRADAVLIACYKP